MIGLEAAQLTGTDHACETACARVAADGGCNAGQHALGNCPSHAVPTVDGSLHLVFQRTQSEPPQTQMRVLSQQPPLRVIRPFDLPDAGKLVHLHNISGGVLGGDQLHVGIAVETGAAAQVTTTGATRIYRHRPNRPDACQHARFAVGPGARLEVLPDIVIPYAGARYRQTTTYDLALDAGLFAWEVISAGREAHGETFNYELLQLETEIIAAGQLIACERVRLEPALRPLTSPVRLGAFRNFATFYACRAGQPATIWTKLEAQLSALATALHQPGESVWAASTLPAHGVVVRGLSRTQRAITAALPQFWDLAKQALYHERAILPRKIY